MASFIRIFRFRSIYTILSQKREFIKIKLDFKFRYSIYELKVCVENIHFLSLIEVFHWIKWSQVINLYFWNKKISNACLKLVLDKNVWLGYTICRLLFVVLQDISQIYKLGNKLYNGLRKIETMFGVWIYPGRGLD